MMWVVAALSALALCSFLLVALARRKRRLRPAQREKILSHWSLLESINDPHRRILEADKILEQAMAMLGYQGSLGAVLKKAGPRFSNLQGIWIAHKLRNRIAHEVNVTLSEWEVTQALKVFRQAIDDLS